MNRGLPAIALLLLALAPGAVQAGKEDIIEAIRNSEFRFARSASGSQVPFIPIGWAQYRDYPKTEFSSEDGSLPSAVVAERSLNVGGVLPAYVAPRDMILLGGDLLADHIHVRSGPYADQRVLGVTPVAAWLRQWAEKETLAVFLAPTFSKERNGNQPWSTNGYGGILDMHWHNDTVQWIYGAVYEYSFGKHSLYPYVGVNWLPTPQLSLALVFPWPTITYVPAQDWLLQLTLGPGGSSWVARGSGYESTQSLDSWNLTAGAAYRLTDSFWLFAGVGRTGLRGFTRIGGGNEANFQARSGPVYTLAIQFRPF